ncbi:MAG: type 1 glutamine amidotransferase [Thermoleophilia bacterium]
MSASVTVRLGHLYPAEMNIYADRGNIAVFARRLAWRGMALEVTPLGIGDRVSPGAHDLFYLGGGQDRDQVIVARDLAATKADALHAAVDDGAAMLCVCGGFQLAGHGYTGVDGGRMPGIGLLDLDTVAGPTRLIGDLVIDAELDGQTCRVVGFENHAGRTHLGPGARPLGRVVHGHGNNDEDGFEGGVQRRVIGTYLHGPLLPKNPWVADRLLAWALDHRTGSPVALTHLDDSLEERARAVATDRAARHRER